METYMETKKMNTKNLTLDVFMVSGIVKENIVEETNKPTVTKKVRQLKRKQSITFSAKLKINGKKYAIKQSNWFYGMEDEEEPTENNLRDYWYVTTGTMKAIIKNNKENFNAKLTSYFDGMIDCTSNVENPEFSKPSKEWYERILNELSRRGLFSIHYQEKTKIFKAYSCCDSFEFSFDGDVEIL
jgi:hypothetical protein